MRSVSAKHLLLPFNGGALQRLLHVNVRAAVVSDDEVEVGVSSVLEQLLHLGNQVAHPATLVFD